MGIQESGRIVTRIVNTGICLNERDEKQCRVSLLLLADDAVLIVDSAWCLQGMVNEIGVVC